MAKKKKKDGTGGRLLVMLATTGAAFAVRKVMAIGWKKITGKEPPTDLSDPKVTLPEALGWAVLLGVAAEMTRFAMIRATGSRALPEADDAENNGHRPRGRQPAGTGSSGSALTADQLTVPVFGKLAAVVHKEATRTSELVRLPGDHPERELLVRQVSSRQLKRLGDVVRVKVDGARRLVHPASLQFLEAVLGHVVIGLARAVVISSHCGDPSPSIGGARSLRGCNAREAKVVPDSGGEFSHVPRRRARRGVCQRARVLPGPFRPLVNRTYRPSIPRADLPRSGGGQTSHASRSASSPASTDVSAPNSSGPAATVIDVLGGAPPRPPTTAPASSAISAPAA